MTLDELMKLVAHAIAIYGESANVAIVGDDGSIIIPESFMIFEKENLI